MIKLKGAGYKTPRYDPKEHDEHNELIRDPRDAFFSGYSDFVGFYKIPNEGLIYLQTLDIS